MSAKSCAIVIATMVRQRRNSSGFGERLARLRKSRHMTQVELAKAIDVSQALISFYEKGSTEPSTSVMIDLARALHVSADELLGLHKNGHKEQSPDDLRLMRRLRQVQKLPFKDRRSVLQLIESLITKEEALHRVHG